MKKQENREGMLFKRLTFQKLLNISVLSTVILVVFLFSFGVLRTTEDKLRENARSNMEIVLRQYDTYLENYVSSVYNGLKTLEANTSVVQLQITASDSNNRKYIARNYVQVKRLIDQLMAANSTCVSNIYLNFDNGRIVSQAYNSDLMKISYSYRVWKERFPENKYYWVDADSCRDLIQDEGVGAVLFHLYGSETGEHNGIMLMGIKSSFIREILDVTALDTEGIVGLITDYGCVSFGAEKAMEFLENNQERIRNGADSVNRFSMTLDGYYTVSKRMNLTGWTLVYLVSEKSISNAHYVFREILILGAAEILICAVLIWLISGAVSRPLKKLTAQVRAEDVLKREIQVQSYQEITALSNGLENMRKHINQLLRQVELDQEEKRQIELALLQEQINPHFLYNTLNAIIQLCEMNQTEKASRMTEALSAFYRIGLSGGNSMICVEEELDHVRNYLLIQHYRYSNLFEYTIDCELELLKCRIPKMSLQPLVENAIYHGIRMRREPGNICIIGGTYDGETAYLEVHDDGPGISPEKLQEIRNSLSEPFGKTRFALRNVNSRIRVEFGEAYGLELYSEPQDTCVRIIFKMERIEE